MRRSSRRARGSQASTASSTGALAAPLRIVTPLRFAGTTFQSAYLRYDSSSYYYYVLLDSRSVLRRPSPRSRPGSSYCSYFSQGYDLYVDSNCHNAYTSQYAYYNQIGYSSSFLVRRRRMHPATTPRSSRDIPALPSTTLRFGIAPAETTTLLSFACDAQPRGGRMESNLRRAKNHPKSRCGMDRAQLLALGRDKVGLLALHASRSH